MQYDKFLFPKVLVLIISVLLNINLLASTLETHQQPSELEINENYAEYIFQYPQMIKKLKQEQKWLLIAEEIGNLSESLYQLKLYKELEAVIRISKSFLYTFDKERYYKLLIIDQKRNYDIGKYQLCRKKLKSILQQVKTNKLKNSIYLLLASIDYQLDEIDNARMYYEKIWNNQPHFLHQIQAYNGIGSCCFMNSMLDSASYYYEKGLEICNKYHCNNHTRAAQIIMNLSQIYKELGNY